MAAVAGATYLAAILKNYRIARVISVTTAGIFYWMGYGGFHSRVFKNTTFDGPVKSLKGFLFFLLFLMAFLVVFGRYFKQILSL